ncbi:hypothetical protein P9112_006612 [Eukaryota sp. TZLM1-RC]
MSQSVHQRRTPATSAPKRKRSGKSQKKKFSFGSVALYSFIGLILISSSAISFLNSSKMFRDPSTQAPETSEDVEMEDFE